MKTAFDAFKINEDGETNKKGLLNALRVVFYNLTVNEIEKFVNEIYAQDEKNTEENVKIFDVLGFFDDHPEITNEEKA